MLAYAKRQDWDRLFNTFRIPARYQQPRTAEHYDIVYRAAVASGSAKVCTDMLRWVYPEMKAEEPPVQPTGQVYESLKACILTADPAAAQLLHHPPTLDSLDLISQRKLQNREFVKMLREVEDVHVGLRRDAAQRETASAVERMADAESPMV